jgi:hypothetical protein
LMMRAVSRLRQQPNFRTEPMPDRQGMEGIKQNFQSRMPEGGPSREMIDGIKQKFQAGLPGGGRQVPGRGSRYGLAGSLASMGARRMPPRVRWGMPGGRGRRAWPKPSSM